MSKLKKILCILVAVLMLVALSPPQVHAAPQPCVQTPSSPYWTCTIPLVVGWNLISLPVVPNMTANANSVDLLFNQTGLSLVTSVFTFTYTGKVGSWQFCASKYTAPKWSCVGTLKFMVDGKGYWILTKGPSLVVLKVVGSVIPPGAPPPAYALQAGWNLVGYKAEPDPNTHVDHALDWLHSIDTLYEIHNVWVYNSGTGSWTRTADDPVYPGQAMWLLLSAAATFYP